MVPMRSTIRHLDVFRNPLRGSRLEKPYVVCIQHHLLDYVATRVTASLLLELKGSAGSRLNPEIRMDSRILYLDPTDMMTFSIARLGRPIANLAAERDKIVAALDLVFTGI